VARREALEALQVLRNVPGQIVALADDAVLFGDGGDQNDFRFSVSGFRFGVWGLGLWVFDFGFWVGDLGLW
jgi:hypothetical protein